MHLTPVQIEEKAPISPRPSPQREMSNENNTNFVSNFLYCFVKGETDVKVVEAALRKCLSEYKIVGLKFKINLVINREDPGMNYVYAWVNDNTAYHLLRGNNPDGSERGLRCLEHNSDDDAKKFPEEHQDMSARLERLDKEVDLTLDSWGAFQDEWDSITNEYKVDDDPLIVFPYKIFPLSHVKAKKLRGNVLCINPPAGMSFPSWLTTEMLWDHISYMIPDSLKKIILEKNKKGQGFVNIIENDHRIIIKFPQNNLLAVGISQVCYKAIMSGPKRQTCPVYYALQPIEQKGKKLDF